MFSATLCSGAEPDADAGIPAAVTHEQDAPPATASSSAYSSGDVLLDRYRLISPLAEGGSGRVWVALNTVLGVHVAVKIITSSAREPATVSNRRAESEARLCAQLAHPAICRVLDFGFTDHRDPFVVTELLQGETLDDLLARETRLTPVRAVQLLLPILDALEAAHDHGVVHRDVKPANIFLAREGDSIQPKLLDFGIARCLNPVEGKVTNTGVVCGTPFYMSPEQARGSSDIDPRSDLWSFCVTLHEALAGNPPFSGENYNEILWSILHSAPASLESCAEVDPLLSRIMQRGLCKAREQRWCSAAALSQELASWLLRHGVDSDIRGLSLRQRLPASAAPESVKPVSSSTVPTSDPEVSATYRVGTRSGKRPAWLRWSGAAGLAAVLGTVAAIALSGSLAESPAPFESAPIRAQAVSAPVHMVSVDSSLPAPSDIAIATEQAPKEAAPSVEPATEAPKHTAVRRAAEALPSRRHQAPVNVPAQTPAIVQPSRGTALAASNDGSSVAARSKASAGVSESAPRASAVASNRRPNALSFDFGL